MGNDPINANDPTGNYSEVTVNGSNVNITIPVRYEVMAGNQGTLNRFNNGVQDTWKGQIGKYNVTNTVQQLSWWQSLWTADNKQNVVKVVTPGMLAWGTPNGREYADCKVGGACTVTLSSGSTGLTAAHEIGGHAALFLDDQYSGYTVKPGYPQNGIMGTVDPARNPVATEIDIARGIQNVQNGFSTVPRGPAGVPEYDGSAAGGFLLYPNKSNNNGMLSVYKK